MEKDIVVIDTNVWLSAILKNKTEKIVLLTTNFGVAVYTCPELTLELKRNLIEDKYFKTYISNPQQHIDLFSDLTLNQSIEQRFDRANDIKDNFLFDLAYTIKSYYIVTSEKRLLNMKQVNKIHIISPTAYFAMFAISW